MKSAVPSILVSLVAVALGGGEPAAGSPPIKPYVSVGFDFGPGSASWEDVEGRVSGGQGALFITRTWSGPWAYGVAAHFWWHSQDTTRTELTVAGPALTWHSRMSGPLVRLTLGLAYQHNMLEFAQTSLDDRLDGFGMAGSAAWEFRMGRYFALGPQVDVAKLWLPDGRSANFWGGSVGLSLYLPVEQQAAGATSAR